MSQTIVYPNCPCCGGSSSSSSSSSSSGSCCCCGCGFPELAGNCIYGGPGTDPCDACRLPPSLGGKFVPEITVTGINDGVPFSYPLGAIGCNIWEILFINFPSQGISIALLSNVFNVSFYGGFFGSLCPSYVGSGPCTGSGTTIVVVRQSPFSTCPATSTVVLSW